MTGESLVDLLLVRLSRDEEKAKVCEMLISVLGMTEQEAADSVAQTPVLLSKCLPMEEARVVQERMYPYVDLLPRVYGECESTPVPKHHPDTPAPQEIDGQDGSYVHEFERSGLTRSAGDEPEIIYDDDEAERDKEPHGDEAFVITSASEEMLSIERCHICGRTPTTDEKLAPCRTCGELTCSDCFDRFVHVCSKCAAEGRMIDRPIKGEPEYRKRDEPEIEETATAEVSAGRRSVSPMLLVILGIALLGAAFYFLDPLSLFGPGEEVLQDTVAVLVPDSLSIALSDSLASAADTSAADTSRIVASDSLAAAQADSIAADSVTAGEVIPLADLQLPEDVVIPEELTMPTLLLTTPVQGLDILSDSLQLISYNLSCLIAAASVQSEGVTLVRTPDSTEILILSILHPEPMQERMRLVSTLAAMLDGSSVDQLVIYYRESTYYTPELFSLVADSFQVIAGALSPGFIHGRQTSLPGTWEMVSGPIMDWILQL